MIVAFILGVCFLSTSCLSSPMEGAEDILDHVVQEETGADTAELAALNDVVSNVVDGGSVNQIETAVAADLMRGSTSDVMLSNLVLFLSSSGFWYGWQMLLVVLGAVVWRLCAA